METWRILCHSVKSCSGVREQLRPGLVTQFGIRPLCHVSVMLVAPCLKCFLGDNSSLFVPTYWFSTVRNISAIFGGWFIVSAALTGFGIQGYKKWNPGRPSVGMSTLGAARRVTPSVLARAVGFEDWRWLESHGPELQSGGQVMQCHAGLRCFAMLQTGLSLDPRLCGWKRDGRKVQGWREWRGQAGIKLAFSTKPFRNTWFLWRLIMLALNLAFLNNYFCLFKYQEMVQDFASNILSNF